MPLLGTPRLSRMVSSWSFGTSSRMAASTSSASRAVSSMRVPVGARMCRRIWPASTLGKKSRPSTGYSRQDSRQKPRKSAMNAPALAPAGPTAPACRRAARARTGGRSCGRRAAAGSGWCRRLPWRGRRPSAASPASAPACARAGRTRASRTPPPRPAARTGSAPRRTGRTSARTRCRCTASRRRPAAPISPAPTRIASLQLGAHVQVALDVLDGHDRLVDQDADRERQPAQRHQVERLARARRAPGSTPGSTAEWSAR